MRALPLRVVEANARVYRGTWKGSAVTAFLSPVLFLLAMGVGLGSLVDRGPASQALDGLSYMQFLAPGLLAATAMQTAAGEATWPVMAGIKWAKTYHAALATPVRVSDLVSGNFIWAGIRVLLSAVAFVVVMTVFGTVEPERAPVMVLPAVLTGLAFAGPISAYTPVAKDESRLAAVFRFGIIPMFLFSGTFFPVEQLPQWLQPAALIFPLWHGVELCRAVALGSAPSLSAAVHVVYLFAWAGAGLFLAQRSFTRRLRT